MRGLAVVLCAGLAACEGLPTAATTPDDDALIAREWNVARGQLENYGYSREVLDQMQPWHFDWTKVDGPFKCGKVQANGCYGGGRIKWNAQTPTVIRHEAGHAILDKLGDSRWKCYEHTC